MKAVLLTLLVLALTGCATPKSLLEQEPVISEESGKTPEEYVECVSPLWQDFNPAVSISPTTTGYRLTTLHSMAGTDDVLVINESSQGSSVRLFQRIEMMRQPLRDAVRQCL